MLSHFTLLAFVQLFATNNQTNLLTVYHFWYTALSPSLCWRPFSLQLVAKYLCPSWGTLTCLMWWNASRFTLGGCSANSTQVFQITTFRTFLSRGTTQKNPANLFNSPIHAYASPFTRFYSRNLPCRRFLRNFFLIGWQGLLPGLNTVKVLSL